MLFLSFQAIRISFLSYNEKLYVPESNQKEHVIFLYV